MKRVLSIQDISCVGKCSLTVALPILSAMGVETAVLPTAVLSTHTAFPSFTFHDLTAELSPIAAEWEKYQITFDAIYTGYLGSFEQLHLVSRLIETFQTRDTLVFLDPVMGDHGKLYPGFTKAFVREMAKLCGKADVIVPNLTEAAYLLDIPYPGEDYDEGLVRDILYRLSGLGAKKVILTGASFDPARVGVMAYDAETETYFSYYNERLPEVLHGTGDIFASTCVGALMNGYALGEAVAVAVDYTLESIRKTREDPERRSYGVSFEAAIPNLIHRLEQEAH